MPGVNGGESQFAGLKGSKSLGWRRQEGDCVRIRKLLPHLTWLASANMNLFSPWVLYDVAVRFLFSVCFLHSVSTPTLRYLIPAFTEQTSAWSLMLALNLQCAAWSSYFLYWRPLTLQLLLPSATANPSLLVDIKRISTSAGKFPQNPPDLKPYLTMMDQTSSVWTCWSTEHDQDLAHFKILVRSEK